MCSLQPALLALKLLATFAQDPTPWLHWEANSEQRSPLYFGSTPLQLSSSRRSVEPQDSCAVAVPKSLEALAERFSQLVSTRLKEKHKLGRDVAVELEMWPVANDDGDRTWAMARWRIAGASEWSWLDSRLLRQKDLDLLSIEPELPVTLSSSDAVDRAVIFSDFLNLGLYEKPAFANCVFSSAQGDQVMQAWLNPLERDEASRKKVPLICHAISQVPRWNGVPVGFVYSTATSGFIFPSTVRWSSDVSDGTQADIRPSGDSLLADWPSQFQEAYSRDIRALSGEAPASYPISKRTKVFKKKNNATASNDLEDVVQYLEERYRELSIKTVRQTFTWRGTAQANLIAIIPGTLDSGRNNPVLLMDHIDTAYSQETYENTGRRTSAPGADDNASATAALLQTASIFKSAKPAHDIWLVHLTGEEFPADDLGARALVSKFLKDRRVIRGAIILDMIAFRKADDPLFQINTGDSTQSIQMGQVALEASKALSQVRKLGGLRPVVRSRFDRRSYLYNTDGLIFSDAGFPVLLINEHINAYENLGRPHYHEKTDLSGTLDLDYAEVLTRVAAETVLRIAR